MGTLDIALRLGAATLVGIVLGLNRDLHGKSTGVRTLGILCLGSALAVLSIHATGSDVSRVIQGIVTGVGFLGAGVIVRSDKGKHVQGLTTAACVWVTACIGAACAVAQWQIAVMGVILVLVILMFGGLELAAGVQGNHAAKEDRYVMFLTAGVASWNMGVGYLVGLLLWYAFQRGWLKA